MLVHCWFLSCLPLYWLLLPGILPIVRDATPRVVFSLAVGCAVGVPGLYYMLASDPEWYKAHAYMQSVPPSPNRYPSESLCCRAQGWILLCWP